MSNPVSYNTSRKLGKFSIPRELIDYDPGLVFTIMSTVIPVRAEYMFENNSIEYVGICHNFEFMPLGEIVPRYKAYVENGFVRWEKQD